MDRKRVLQLFLASDVFLEMYLCRMWFANVSAREEIQGNSSCMSWSVDVDAVEYWRHRIMGAKEIGKHHPSLFTA